MAPTLTVKNTFLDFNCSECRCDSGLRLSSSDPGLFDRYDILSDFSSDHGDCTSDVDDVGSDIIMTGFGDLPSDTEDHDITQHASGGAPSAAFTLANGATTNAAGLARPANIAPTGVLALTEKPDLRSQMQHLAAENARLAEENHILVQAEQLAAKNARLQEDNRLLAEVCQETAGEAMAVANHYLHSGMPHSQPNTFHLIQHMAAPAHCLVISSPLSPLGMQFHVMTQQPHHYGLKPEHAAAQRSGGWQQQWNGLEPNAKFEEKVRRGRDGQTSSDRAMGLPSASEDTRTTVMLRNLPNNYTRAMLLKAIDDEGFASQYDFVYLPIDFHTCCALGYAFVNLETHAVAKSFNAHFEGYSKWMIPSRKKCGVGWSSPHQGLLANIERYRNSPVMHESVPVEYKPIVLRDGVQVPFPKPTNNFRAPRIQKKPCGRNLSHSKW
jgi:hypothetical protein